MTTHIQLAKPAQLRFDQDHPIPSVADLLQLHVRIQQAMSTGDPAQVLADQLCDFVRHYTPGWLASLMWRREDERLGLLAAPGASPALVTALDGTLTLGTRFDRSAAGMHAGTPLLVEDVSRAARWDGQREVAAAHGIRTCWSVPVRRGNRILGMFALSGPTLGPPEPAIVRLLEQAAVLAGTILWVLHLENEQGKQQRRQSCQAERLRRLSGLHAMLSQVSKLAASRPDVTTLYEGVCRIAVAEGGLQLACIGAPDPSGVFHPAAAAGATGFPDEPFHAIDPTGFEDRSLWETASREIRTVIHRRRKTEATPPSRRQAIWRIDCGADVALPLMLRGVPRAVLHIYAAEEGILDTESISLLEELAVSVGRTLEAIDQQHHLDRLEALHTTLMTQGEMLLNARSDVEMLHQTCAHLVEGGLFQVAWIAQPNAMGRMRALASAGPGTAPLAELPVALDDTPPSLVVQCWHRGHTVVSNDMLADPDLTHYRHLMEAGRWRSAAVVPILRGGNRFAVLAIGASQPGVFVSDVVALCEQVAALLSRGLEEFDLKQTLEEERRRQFHLARHDPLTGLPNRRQFEEYLGDALAGVRRRGVRLSVCMLDIDDFKPINDRYGHATGDFLLRQIGQRLRESFRNCDMIARLGGDEFALAIDDPDSIGALPGLLGRISDAMRAPFDFGDGDQVRIGLSVGIAVFPEDGANANILLRRADAALYAAKAAKVERGCNWRRWSDEIVSTVPSSGIDDPYGPEAQRLLTRTEAIWPVIAAEFMEEFYAAMMRQKPAERILAALSPTEFAHLKARQAAHLITLMSASTDRDTVRSTARTVGRVHALTGVDSVLTVHALGIYQAFLARHLAMQPLRPGERQALMAIATARLQEDNAEQMEASSGTVAAYFDPRLHWPQPPDVPWVDAVQTQLDALAGLPGILSVRLLRPDATGALQTLASSSTAGFPFGGLGIADTSKPTIDAARPEGRGLLSEAWHSSAIASTANYQTDARTAPWHEAARRFGVRSAVVLPVPDLDGRPVALLILFGTFPHQFESTWMRHVCADLARGLSLLWRWHQNIASAVVVPEKTAVAWRKRLFGGGLAMHYQPIVDLRTGKTRGVEALARLVLEDGQIIAPNQFLPILGMQDLDELFRRGLAQGLGQIARWDEEGLSLDLNVNLAPSTLCEPGCALWVRDALRQAGVGPERLFLEITEDQNIDANDRTPTAAFAALTALGVRLVMDDLGAGYGSLERLRTRPFCAVKLDQGLIRDMRDSPARSLSFVGALVRLGRDLGIKVVAEGLESDDLVDAATVLGADAGQGLALGRSMPADAIPGWAQDFVWSWGQQVPQTELGVLAAKWCATYLKQD